MELLVATRFGAGIKDPAWFEHRLVLLEAITAPSLPSQTDQGFRVVFTDRQAPTWVRERLDDVLAPFEGGLRYYRESQVPVSPRRGREPRAAGS